MRGGGSGQAGEAREAESTVMGACRREWSLKPTLQQESSLLA